MNKVNKMNYMKTAIIAILIAIVTMGFASAGSTTITWCGSGSYDVSWSGAGGEVTINTYTPQGYDSFYSDFTNGATTGYQTMDTYEPYTVIHRDVSLTDAYATTHTESISGDFASNTYNTDFTQMTAFDVGSVYVYDWT